MIEDGKDCNFVWEFQQANNDNNVDLGIFNVADSMYLSAEILNSFRGWDSVGYNNAYGLTFSVPVHKGSYVSSVLYRKYSISKLNENFSLKCYGGNGIACVIKSDGEMVIPFKNYNNSLIDIYYSGEINKALVSLRDKMVLSTSAAVHFRYLNRGYYLFESEILDSDFRILGLVEEIAFLVFEKAGQVEDYMLRKLTFSDDISVKGVREDQIKKAMPLLENTIEPGERVIVYGNKGILSKGKEYFMVTDRQSIFVKKKNIKTVLHSDIDSLTIEGCGNCYLNGDYEKGFVNLDGKGTFQGAMMAMICMFSFEAQPYRDRIRII